MLLCERRECHQEFHLCADAGSAIKSSVCASESVHLCAHARVPSRVPFVHRRVSSVLLCERRECHQEFHLCAHAGSAIKSSVCASESVFSAFVPESRLCECRQCHLAIDFVWL